MIRRIATATTLIALASTALAGPAPADDARRGPVHPAVVKVKIIGKSVRGTPIRAWQLGNPNARRTVVAMAAMHGDELAPRRILWSLRDGRKLRGINLWLVPTVNPDGARRHHRKNAHGVDLNRNYPVRWKNLDGAYESGPHPRSERETRVMMRFLKRTNPRYVVSFHQPLHGVDSSGPKTSALARRLAKYLHLPRKSFTCGGHCHGTMTQWFNKRRRGAAITVELGTSPSKRYLTRVAPRGLLRAVGGRR
ncbi:M14 family zinc carboxypeptidase [Solicola gregarius]|uniref:DUF2817 domain-containing protein n=1 Tax=Solicola gregarius TaxID=2908642 RepID=A0AA46TJ18_9ACTN|nr:M14 family zinc carboxypeptidase [Solicola gregarius]UYM06175.1 DUF2817 domain-containing protein [Solicola gregarius]